MTLLSATPQFTVPDVVRTAEYYRDVLGFEVVSYWDGKRGSLNADPPPYFAIVRRDEVRVFFNRADGSPPRTGRSAIAYDVFIRVTHVDGLAAEFAQRGAEIIEGPVDRPYGQRELVLRDCNGLIVAFAEATDGP